MRFVVVVALSLMSACALFRSTREEPTRCPESQGLVCLTPVVCSADRDRGCLVCQCAPADQPPGRPIDSAMPVAR